MYILFILSTSHNPQFLSQPYQKIPTKYSKLEWTIPPFQLLTYFQYHKCTHSLHCFHAPNGTNRSRVSFSPLLVHQRQIPVPLCRLGIVVHGTREILVRSISQKPFFRPHNDNLIIRLLCRPDIPPGSKMEVCCKPPWLRSKRTFEVAIRCALTVRIIISLLGRKIQRTATEFSEAFAIQ